MVKMGLRITEKEFQGNKSIDPTQDKPSSDLDDLI